MKRIAIYYDGGRIAGRNDGNPLYIWAALKRRQEKGLLEVEHLAPTGDLSKFGEFDLHIWVDWGEDGLEIPYKMLFPPGRPLVYWASDTHLGYDYRLKCAKQADFAFAAQIEAVADFKRDGVKNPILLPHAVEPEAYAYIEMPIKEYDVAFIGFINSRNRVDALDALFKAVPNFYFGQRRFEEAADIYRRSKIVFNISMRKELNMRVFEVMATGSMLLTDDIPMIHQFFKDGVHMVTYKDEKDMIEKAKYYIEHDEERQKIAEAGMKEVLAHHTIDHRLDVILKEAGILCYDDEKGAEEKPQIESKEEK